MQLTREEKGHHVKDKGMECVCSHDYQPDLSFLDFLISQTGKITYTHTHTHTHCQLNCQLYTCVCVLRHFSRVRLCDPMDCSPPTRLLCLWNSPGKNTGVGCHALLQGVFPTQGSTLYLQHWQVGSLPLTPPGKPPTNYLYFQINII